MSTVKVNEVRHLSNSGTANIVLESNANTNLQTTSTLGLGVTGTLTVSGVSTFNGNVQVGNASTDTMALTSTVSGFNNFSGFTGEIRMYAGDATGESASLIAKGWLFCNGNYIGKTALIVGTGNHHNADGSGNDYEPLFNLLKASSDWQNTSTWDWNTNYVKLPDFRSRSPVGLHTGANNAIGTGADTVALTALTLGDTTGSEKHALIIAESPEHTHTTAVTGVASTGTTISTPAAHAHSLASHTHSIPSVTTTGGSHTHLGSPAICGSLPELNQIFGSSAYTHGGAGNGMTQNGYGGANKVQGPTGSGGAAHTVPANTAAASTTNGGNTGTHDSNQTLTDPQHSHSFAQVNANHGGVSAAGTPHTILSPRIAVNYIIKV
jgi:microcystin-dependent protein|tara:strand:+ start:557 stop:1696 length:1140 start_codon:yes stop_codon:yes gene_type:complete